MRPTRQNDRELVAAEPRQERSVARQREPASDLLEKAVACRMTVHIVDFLKSIEVDAKQRKVFIAGGCVLEDLCEVIAERSPVGQFGERIVKGQVRDAGFILGALGDVLMR